MTKEEANGQISLIENRISEYENNIRDLKLKIEKLDELLYKVQNAESKTEDFKNDQLDILNQLINVNRKAKMLDSYHDDISNIITGTKYLNVMDGFDNIKRLINQKIDELERQIHQLQNSLSYCWSEISSLRSCML